MKYLFCLFTFLSLNLGLAQEMRIPFRVGDKFGLSDKNGHLKVPADYKKVIVLGNGFFLTENPRVDTIKNYLGEKKAKLVTVTGLLYQDKAIIKDQAYREFRFYENNELIVGFENQYHPDHMLFNTRGEQLLEVRAIKVDFNNSRYTDDLGLVNENLTLITADYSQNISCLGVYDKRQKKITKWFLEFVHHYNPKRTIKGTNVLPFSYVNKENVFVEKCLAYNNLSKTFELIDLAQSNKPQYKRTTNSKPIHSYQDEKVIDIDVDYATGGSSSPEYKKRRTEFIITNDTTISFEKDKIEHIPGMTYQKIRKYQKNPLIYRLNGKRGIIFSDKKRTEPVYDSLFYISSVRDFGAHDDQYFYISGKKERGSEQMSFTILDEFGENYISEKFDRIHNFTPQIEMKYDSDKNGKTIRSIIIRKEEEYFTPHRKSFVLFKEFIYGFKNGKRFWINLKTKEITPLNYDEIYLNGFGNLFPIPMEKESYIIKKNEKYAISKTKNPDQDFLDHKFVFSKVPSSYFPNYNSEKGFNLVALLKDGGFFCFAREDGFLYYRE